jgi:hydroxypyruvate isomerase
MKRRAFPATIGAAVAAGPAGAHQAPPAIVTRKGRVKQALMRVVFGAGTKMSFDDMCREAARLGCHGFDLIAPQDWPTLKKYGLTCTMAPAMGVTIRDGLIRPGLHDAIERSMHDEIDHGRMTGKRE